MSFFIASGVSYQTAQKMKKKEMEKKLMEQKVKELKKKKKESQVSRSNPQSPAESLKNTSSSPRLLKSKSKTFPVNAEELTANLTHLKERQCASRIPEDSDNYTIIKRLPADSESLHSPKSLEICDGYSSSPQNMSPSLNQRGRRRSSLVASHNPHKSLKSRHSSKSSVPTVASEVSACNTKDFEVKAKRDEVFNSYFQREIPLHIKPNTYTFIPIVDLSVMNTEKSSKEALLTSAYQVFRYNSFLQTLQASHRTDAVSFSNVRYNSLFKFILRHSTMKDITSRPERKNEEISYYESILAYELFEIRSFLRGLIRETTKQLPHMSEIIHCEELVQLNFTNYVRFVLELPENLPEDVDVNLSKHYKFKHSFLNIGNKMSILQNEDTSEKMESRVTNMLLQLINKTSYEYIMLEKYRIDILSKFHNNSLIDNSNLNAMFELYKSHLSLDRKESVKVLLYNIFYSSQYSSALSVWIPFVSVFESNIYTEDPYLIENYEEYRKNETKTTKHSFEESDRELHEYFTNLKFDDFKKYRFSTLETLVKLHKSTTDSISSTLQLSEESKSRAYTFKPINFEYYWKSLSTIPSESFQLIQCRDMPLQLTLRNYKVVLNEFHRILRKGGSIETPFLQMGSDTINGLKRNSVGSLKSTWSYTDIDLTQLYGIIPNFAEVLLKELSNIFGGNNVYYSVLLLNSVKDINEFLIKNVSLQLYENFGCIEDFFCKFKESNSQYPKENEAAHYYLYIKAVKE